MMTATTTDPSFAPWGYDLNPFGFSHVEFEILLKT